MTLFAAVMLFLLQTSPAVQQPQQTQSTKSSIEGFVVRAGTNEPIARARISVLRTAGPGGAPIQQPGPPQNIPALTTDGQGHFAIKDLDPGSYSLTAQRNGFARQAYGERTAGGPGTPLNIAAGQVFKDVVFRLLPAGALSGRVTDATGEPLAGISIQILRSAYDSDGKRTFQPGGFARTNDRGEYRAYWITPGRYYVSASPNPSPFDGPRAPNSNEVIEPGFVLTYYPGTTDASTASPVEIQPGAELSPIDFTLTQQPLFRIRGRVFDARTGQSPRNVNVSINPRNPTTNLIGAFARTNYNPGNGTFELRDVSPGAYWVRAMALPDSGGPLTPADFGRNTAQVAVEVSNTDLDNVLLALTPGFSINGRIDLEGTPLSTLPDVQRARVFLAPIGFMPGSAPPQQIKPDGTFTLENIHPGDYRLTLITMPPNTYMESARLGRTDVLSGLSISGPVSESLEILLSTKGGQIDGTIVDKEQKPMPGVQAILIPDRQRNRRDLYKFGNSDQNGHFTMRTIAPGDYKIFAWADLEPGAYNDPDFVGKYEALSTPVRVTPSGKLSVEVRVIPQN